MCISRQSSISVFLFYLIIANSLSSRPARSPDESSSQTPSSTGNDREKCGSRQRIDNIITAAEDDQYAQFGEFPWMVAILQTSIGSTNDAPILGYICSGSLLSPTVILTAAHCVYNVDPSTLRIWAGVYDMNGDTHDRPPHQERTVKQVKIHGSYSSKILHNDIALLSVNESFSYDYHIGRICAPLEGTPYISLAPESYNPQKCLVAGWGKNSPVNEGTIPQKLKKVYVDLVSNDQCESVLRTTGLRASFKLHSSFICAKEDDESSTVCQGDGGAPLVCALSSSPPNTKYVQIGVTSWGIGCTNALPGIYASLKTNTEWLNAEFINLNGNGTEAA